MRNAILNSGSRVTDISCCLNFLAEALKLLSSVSAVFGLKTFLRFSVLDLRMLRDFLISLGDFIFTKNNSKK